ncbi:MAG: protein kinase domain-containing protein, partial [Opitutaceae bacterium]
MFCSSALDGRRESCLRRADVPPPVDPTLPPHLPDYALLRLIGRGSYGDVWLARAVTGVFRAVKIIWRDRFPDARPYLREFEGVTRFAAISLREPSQLALLHAGRNDEEGFFYYVMELADDAEQGRVIDPTTYVPLTLRERHARRPMLAPAEVVALGVALSRGLATLHHAGLVHRDIKPSNIVLVGGVPKLADIGLVAAASAGLTFVGTEGFVPPEGPGAPAADVYSLGKVLYELATGLDRHDWPRLPPDLAALPDRRALLELNEVLVRACEPDPRRRFADAGALLDELLLLQAGKSVRRLRAAERRLSRALRMAAMLALISTVAGGGAWFEHQRAAEETQRRHEAEADRDALRQRTVYAARLAQAQRAIEQDDFGRARRLLWEAAPGPLEPDRRGIEWRALSHLAQGDPCDVLRDGGPAIDFMTASPDGAVLAVHDEDRKVATYDCVTLKERHVLPGVQRLAGFSADGKWIIGTNVRNALQRWHSNDGTADPKSRGGANYRPLGTQRADRVIAWVNPVAPDASQGRSAKPGALVVWDFATQREVCRLPMGEPQDETPWEYFRSAIAPSGEEAVVVCGRGRASSLQFRLSYAQLGANGSVSHELLKDFLPSAVGVMPARGASHRWWVAEAQSGRLRVFSPGHNG